MIVDYKLLDKMGIEFPDDFSYESEMGSVRRFLDALPHELCVATEIHENVQDATYFCQVDCTFQANESQEYVHCTFSNFGRMVLVWGIDNVIVKHESKVIKIFNLLEQYGFIPLKRDDFYAVYTGVHDEWAGKRWLDRFFAHY